MIVSYLKTALRNLMKHKGYSVINIIGLALGLTCAIVIMVWVQDEFSFDRFHQNGNTIYRVILETSSFSAAVTSPPLGPRSQAELPEIVNTARFLRIPEKLFQSDHNTFYENGGVVADPSFFEMFTFPFIKGDPKTALTNTDNVVITETMAKKYFGNTDPINKNLIMRGSGPLKVTGVIKDIPQNSHLQFDYVIPFQVLKLIGMDVENWSSKFLQTYIQLNPHANVYETADKMNNLYHRYSNDANIKLVLQNLKDIHLTYGFQYDNALVSDRKYIWIFSLAAFIVLFIACMNFINFVTVSSVLRCKEVGLRKTIGASRLQLAIQFLSESGIIIAISALLSIIIAEIILTWFNRISGKILSIRYTSYEFIIGFLIIIVLTGLIAAVYPAVYLSALKPVQGFKSIFHMKRKKSVSFRSILVVAQFSLSIALIVSTFIISNQVSFMRNTTMGFNKENIMYLPIRGEINKVYRSLKDELLRNPNISSVSLRDCMPTVDGNATSWVREGRSADEGVKLEYNVVDCDYIKTMGMEVAEGRDFSINMISDVKEACILNEEAKKEMGKEATVGKWILVNGQNRKIIGIVKDAHFKSLQYKTSPQIMTLVTDFNSPNIDDRGVIFIRTKKTEMPIVLADIKELWYKFNPDFPFEFHFLDETIDNLYMSEVRINTILTCFTMLAIGISCLGLFGMSSFLVNLKTKDIGVRKVLGASISNIVLMLVKDFTKWVLLSNVIAWPVAYYFNSKWLQDFAYRINISWWMFILSGSIALLIALVTVSFHAIKAATANPIESLRYE